MVRRRLVRDESDERVDPPAGSGSSSPSSGGSGSPSASSSEEDEYQRSSLGRFFPRFVALDAFVVAVSLDLLSSDVLRLIRGIGGRRGLDIGVGARDEDDMAPWGSSAPESSPLRSLRFFFDVSVFVPAVAESASLTTSAAEDSRLLSEDLVFEGTEAACFVATVLAFDFVAATVVDDSEAVAIGILSMFDSEEEESDSTSLILLLLCLSCVF